MKRVAMFLMACLLCAGILVVAPPEASAAVQEIPLVECERINRSNEDGHYADVVVGKWDCKAGRLADSIRFCVANKRSYKNTHYCSYRLRGEYDTLSGIVSFSPKSDRFATAQVKIYYDNELAFDSGLISERSEDVPFSIDVSDVEVVRVVCSTPDRGSAYCVVSATVS